MTKEQTQAWVLEFERLHKVKIPRNPENDYPSDEEIEIFLRKCQQFEKIPKWHENE